MRQNPALARGFTLIEIIVAISILGIIGGVIAMFIRTPVEGYTDSARHAEMGDIADTAMARITRELRLALPNSVRVQNASGSACNGAETCYLEFIPLLDGGHYCSAPNACASAVLNTGSAVSSFYVLGAMPAFAPGNRVVVYNLGTASHSAYDTASSTKDNAAWISTSASSVNISPTTFSADSPNHGFYVIYKPVSYVCAPAADGTGTLTRYWGYSLQANQPVAVPIAGASSALLANNISACSFAAPPGSTTPGVVTVQLTISENGDRNAVNSISLYIDATVGNVP